MIPEVQTVDQDRDNIIEVEIARIQPNPKQPRKRFDQVKLEELAASIREHGVVQPIVLRLRGDMYEIVAGERRWRAAELAGLKKVPALVREFSEAEVMEIALIENLQREDLNPLEEAEAYRVLMEEFHLTQEELGKRLGKSRSQIANTLRLLQLGAVAREELRAGRLSMGHAKVLLGVEDAAVQGALAARSVQEGLSVRELEAKIRSMSQPKVKEIPRRTSLSPDLADVERRLRERFGTPVRLTDDGKKGKIEITFFGEEGLGRILEALGLYEERTPQGTKGPFHV